MASVHFRTSILLKSVIGKDLITDDNVAVLELVKNSFDANSEGVSIVFRNILDNDDKSALQQPTAVSSKMLIRDTGTGMTFSDIENKWLNIAYSEKKAIRKEFGRMLAGNKGVGRFSCDRLGRFLDIYTRRQGDDFYLHLAIDWQRFEVDNEIDLTIQDVELDTDNIPVQEFEARTGHPSFEHGTLLEVSRLREVWSYDKIISLKRQLEKLINPNQAFNSNAFSIEIDAVNYFEDDKNREEYYRVNGQVKNKIFDNLNFKSTSIYSQVDAGQQSITTVLSHKGQDVFKLVEKNPFKFLEDVKVTVYYLNTYSKAYFTRQTGIRAVDFGSIFLFINGFRIPPYGDAGDDWLGMDIRKNQGYSRYLGSREIVGRIEINDEKERFKIISSRTGVVNDKAFEELAKSTSPYGYFYKAFRRLERFVVEGIAFDSSSVHANNAEDVIERAGDSWDESQEQYTEDELTKNKRIITIIRKIIDLRPHELISLEINEEFVEELIQEQVETAQHELNRITEELLSRNLGERELVALRDRLTAQLREVTQLNESVAYHAGIQVDTTSVEKELRKLIDHLSKEAQTLREQLAAQVAEQKRIEAEHAAEKQRMQAELEAERREALFIKKMAGTDVQEVINLQHHIDKSTEYINVTIGDLIGSIQNGADKDELLGFVDRISMENRKIASIAQFVTNANFNLMVASIDEDLSRFIKEYIENVHQEYRFLKLNRLIIPVEVHSDKKPFVCSFRPLEIIMLIDNFFSNSRKAKAQHVTVRLFVTEEGNLEFSFADDGTGISDSILPRIFNLGFTTTDGSGIGLSHIKQIVNEAAGTIEVNNKIKGVEFKILFPPLT